MGRYAMTKEEALRLALEALEIDNKEWKLLADSGDAGNWEAEEQGHYQLNEQAIKAIKEALETKDEPMACAECGVGGGHALYCVACAEMFLVFLVKKAIEQEPVACVYKATTKKGETAHFGEYSAAKAWAGWGSVEAVPLKTLTLIDKLPKLYGTCEALARTAMLDQTSHDTTPPQRTWVGLTDEDEIDWEEGGTLKDLVKAIEAKLKEKNT